MPLWAAALVAGLPILVNLAGREGAVLRRTVAVALPYALLGGLLARYLFVQT